MNFVSSFPTALFLSCILHGALVWAMSLVYNSFHTTGVPVYFVDLVQEMELTSAPPAEPEISKPNPPPLIQPHLELEKKEAIQKKYLVPNELKAIRHAPEVKDGSVSDSPGVGSAETIHHEVLGNGGRELGEFQATILKRLESFKKYPMSARRRGDEGRGIMRLQIARNGSLVSVNLDASTGSDVLDEELLSLAKRASPFPQIPSSIEGEVITLKVPVSFRLN